MQRVPSMKVLIPSCGLRQTPLGRSPANSCETGSKSRGEEKVLFRGFTNEYPAVAGAIFFGRACAFKTAAALRIPIGPGSVV
jgi:hypothetical protein